MSLYQKENLEFDILKEYDVNMVIKLFDKNNKLGDKAELNDLMKSILSKKINNNCIFVLRDNNQCIAYATCHVNDKYLILDYMCVDLEKQNMGYGKIMTTILICLATKENRELKVSCTYPNNLWKKMGFQTEDNISFTSNKKIHSDIKEVFTKTEEPERITRKLEIKKEPIK